MKALAPKFACAKIAHMDKELLGKRIADARELAGMTQAELGAAVELDRTAISRLEKGERKLNVTELVSIAQAVERPLAFFMAEPVAAVVSRRRDQALAHETTRLLDVELQQFATDVRTLLTMGLLNGAERSARVPRTHEEAEGAAARCRDQLELGSDPIEDLGAACEQLGLFTYGAPLGPDQADGGCVEVETETAIVGAAVINGDAPAGRRRMTLAHELGHWLFGDAYDSASSMDSERMINSFAIHLLAPRAGVDRVWQEHSAWPLRDRALATGAHFRVSWSANVAQLRNLDLITYREYDTLRAAEPRRGDFLRLGVRFVHELSQPYLSPRFTAAVMDAYATGRLTADRALEFTRGMLDVDDLPEQIATMDDLRSAFAGHDG